jgi:hypothetical protein
VPHDVELAGADRAARADLADARRDIEGREAEDAERVIARSALVTLTRKIAMLRSSRYDWLMK